MTAIHERAGRFHPDSWWLSLPWLAFLAGPVIAIAAGDATLGIAALGYATITAFAGAYVFAYWHRCDDGEFVGLGISLAVMATATLIVAAIEPEAALGLLPFFPPVVNFLAPIRVAVVVNIVAIIAALGATVASGGELWIFIPIVFGVAIFTGLVRLVEERERSEHAHREELAATDERLRIARDVHDVLGHSLTAVILKTELAAALLGRVVATDDTASTLERARCEVAELDRVARHALADVRSTVGGLRRGELASELAATHSILNDAGIDVTVSGDIDAVPPDRRAVFAWVMREATTNIVRHAGARRVTVELAPGSLRIHDDGHGMGDQPYGNGLRGLAERVDEIGGTMDIRGEPGTGTTVEVAP